MVRLVCDINSDLQRQETYCARTRTMCTSSAEPDLAQSSGIRSHSSSIETLFETESITEIYIRNVIDWSDFTQRTTNIWLLFVKPQGSGISNNIEYCGHTVHTVIMVIRNCLDIFFGDGIITGRGVYRTRHLLDEAGCTAPLVRDDNPTEQCIHAFSPVATGKTNRYCWSGSCDNSETTPIRRTPLYILVQTLY